MTQIPGESAYIPEPSTQQPTPKPYPLAVLPVEHQGPLDSPAGRTREANPSRDSLLATHLPGLNAVLGPAGTRPWRLAKLAAWYLALVGTLGVAAWLTGRLEFLPFALVSFGPAPLQILLLILGLVFVHTRIKVGAYLSYGVHLALGLVGMVFMFRWYMATTGAIAAIGAVFALVAIATVFVGMYKVPAKAPKPTPQLAVANRAEQEHAWRVAELQKWEHAYRAAHNGEAPPAGFAPPISGAPPQAKTNTMAILALIFGLFGWLGILFGNMALRQIRETGEAGEGMAKAGRILGIINTCVGAIVVVGTIAFNVWLSSAFES